MKRVKNITIKAFSIMVACILFHTTSYAQTYSKQYFANVDWQFNVPLNNKFASTASGWGMNLEGGYFITPRIGVGLFIAFSNNHEYIPTETFPISNTGTITTNQQRSIYQMPFGASIRYKMDTESVFSPYVALKVGPSFSRISSFISTYKIYDNTWGFYFSPEIGTNIWFTSNKTIGLNLSVYYSFSTNKATVLNGEVNNLSNFGFRVGLGF